MKKGDVKGARNDYLSALEEAQPFDYFIQNVTSNIRKGTYEQIPVDLFKNLVTSNIPKFIQVFADADRTLYETDSDVNFAKQTAQSVALKTPIVKGATLEAKLNSEGEIKRTNNLGYATNLALALTPLQVREVYKDENYDTYKYLSENGDEKLTSGMIKISKAPKKTEHKIGTYETGTELTSEQRKDYLTYYNEYYDKVIKPLLEKNDLAVESPDALKKMLKSQETNAKKYAETMALYGNKN